MVEFIDHDLGMIRVTKDLEKLHGYAVKIGIMGDQTVEGTSVVDIAVYNEFGTSRIPARPFMMQTYALYGDDADKYIQFLAGTMIDGKTGPMEVLKDFGLWYETQMKHTIVDAREWAVPNADSTVAMKGSSSPLIDTGRMLGAVKFEIVKE